MNLTSAIQEGLATILCYDDTPGGSGFIKGLVPLKSYDPYFRRLAEKATDYHNRYKKAPGEHTLDLIDELKESYGDEADIYEQIFESILASKDSINVQFIVDQAQKFVRYQQIRSTVGDVIEVLNHQKEGFITEAEGMLDSCLKRTSTLFDRGTLLTDHRESLKFLDEEVSSFPTGIHCFDKYGLGPARGTLHMFMALPGRGKTWWLTHLGKMAMMNRLKVVHISLEMSETALCKRYIQSFFSISKSDAQVAHLLFDHGEGGLDFQPVFLDRPSLKDENIREVLESKLERFVNRPPVIIKQFPTGSLTIGELEAYLNRLESLGTIPDLLIVDYPDIMKIDSADPRRSIGQLIVNLRGIAVSRNIAIAAVTQSNRQGVSARTIKEDHASEDFSKVMTADTLISYNQTEIEKELGLARLFAIKGRDSEVDKFTVFISQNYSIGQFVVDQKELLPDRVYWEAVDREGSDD